ncbi:patatin-like phospholipase family protein [uncultured Ruminococcus sp.]|uniref:patatin-like phospholipase family protein n=1 Tax=uncultured Ruminococcus sp. TaxID=165186 RepID=UPI0025D078AF|nr:patatin-like phospholipase family protein [uncultured Ruminococcus sp.]
MNGFGLVFSGGGGKGAYEIGVWKYLHEIGMDNYVKAVSGTSVGALNAALFTGSSYEQAEEMWMNINQSKILSPKKIKPEDIANWLIKNGLNIASVVTMGVSKVASAGVWTISKLAEMILTKAKGDHLFSREGLSEMIEESINIDMLNNNDIPCFVTCVKCPGFKIERFKLNEYLYEEALTILLASSAIPIVFPNELFHGQKYCDGGIPLVGDNTPIQPIYYYGVDNIIVVHLNRETVIDRSQYPDSNIIEIVPSIELGNAMNGTLDFSASGAKQRIDVGYEDAKKVLQPMLEMLVMSFKNQLSLEELKARLNQFEIEKSALKAKESEIKEQMANDGFDEVVGNIKVEE